MHEDFVRWEEPYSITSMSKDKKRKNKSESIKAGDTLNEDENKNKKEVICNQSEETCQKKSPNSKESRSIEVARKKPSLCKRNFEDIELTEEAALPQCVPGIENKIYQYEVKMKHLAPEEMNIHYATASRSRNRDLKDQAERPTDNSFLGSLGDQSFEKNTRVGFSEYFFTYDPGNPDSSFVQQARSPRKCLSLQQPMNFQPNQSGHYKNVPYCDSNMSSSNANISTIAPPKDMSTTSINSWMSSSDKTSTAENVMLSNVAMQARDDGYVHLNANNRNSHGVSNIQSATAFDMISENVLSPLAIFSPTSDNDIAHGRNSVSAFATSIAEKKSNITIDEVEDVDEEEMDRDLRAYFAELDETIRKEQEKHAKND